jgi:hypothetical protein
VPIPNVFKNFLLRAVRNAARAAVSLKSSKTLPAARRVAGASGALQEIFCLDGTLPDPTL